jgi:hypothetical protein
MDLNVFSINSAADEGVWIALQDAEFLIARAQNPRFVAAFQQRTKPYRAALDMDLLDESIAGPLWAGIFADTILLNWRGNLVLDGAALTYSRENAIKLLTDKRLKFMGWVREQAAILENAHATDAKEAVATVAKN